MREKIEAAFRAADEVLDSVRSLASHSGPPHEAPGEEWVQRQAEKYGWEVEEIQKWTEDEVRIRNGTIRQAEELLRISDKLEKALVEMRERFGDMRELMEFSYSALGPCSYFPHSRWSHSDVDQIGTAMLHWARDFYEFLLQERSHLRESIERKACKLASQACPYGMSHEDDIRSRMILEKSQLLRDLSEPPKPDPSKRLSLKQQQAVDAAAIWLAFRQTWKEERSPEHEDAFPIAIQLGWKGTKHLFSASIHRGMKQKEGLRKLADRKAREIQIP